MKSTISPQPWYAIGDGWTLTQTEWAPEKNIYFETIFTQSNGYMGIRGYTEETNADLKACREGYLAGVFGQVDQAALDLLRVKYDWPMLCMITLPEIFGCDLVLNGEMFQLSSGTVAAFRRSLDMRNGVLARDVTWTSPAGHRTRLVFERFLSAATPHLGVQRITVTPENWSGTATLTYKLDGAIPTYFRCGDRSFPHLPQAILHDARVDARPDSPSALTVQTQGTNHTVGLAAGLAGAPAVSSAAGAVLTQTATLALVQGKSASVLRGVAIVSSRDGVKPAQIPGQAAAIVRTALAAGYDQTLAASAKVWDDRWAASDVAVDGPARDQAYIRFGAFSMLQMAPFHTDTMSIPARAYAYNRYHGLYYWDSETFLLPQYLHTHPEVAKNLLTFRHRTLDGARRAAKYLKSAGACFPWMTDSDDGTEQAPWHLGDYLWHQNADIAYAIDQYVQATGDRDFMADKGLEMLVESARFWMSRIEEDAAGVVHLHDTVGPDELDKHGKDNGYTSLLARRHFRLAAHWLAQIKASHPAKAKALVARLKLAASEPEAWVRAASRLAVPMVPEGNFPLQDEFLLAKKPLSFDGMTADEAFAKRHTHRVVKQADIIVAMYLLQDEFSLDQMKAAYDFYEPMCLHYSSLSYNTHSIIATKIGRAKQAYEYFEKAAGLDLDNLRDATSDGLHAAALGGTWQTIVLGFLGMRVQEDTLTLEPRIPAAWKKLNLSLVFRGFRLKLDATADHVRIKAEGGAGRGPARLALNGKEHELADGIVIDEALHRPACGGATGKPAIQGVIFDLDGVIVSTDELHFRGWKQLADEEGIPFTRHDNERLRGVSRMESLEIILEKSKRAYSAEEKHAMAERKNRYYRDLLKHLTPADILPGVQNVLAGLKAKGVKMAIGSSSKNAVPILKAIGLADAFDAIADGTHIQRSKPDPEVFTLAGRKLGLHPDQCLVVEDAEAGVDAGLAAGMAVLAVGSAVKHPKATLAAPGLADLAVDKMLRAGR